MTARRASTIVALCALATLAAPALAQPAKKKPPPAPPAATKFDTGNLDIAYGAFQRGYYLTALAEATKRAQQNDTAAMTLLGEIYAQGLGVGRDD
ncbi:MAG: sel1 repeat family protein, partial [Hyphomicrobiales bacterium]